ncbi:MAG: radical SAM family heme chaperone HemW [Clostridiales bacterium]|jgi:oxygen-independent coproporphyrinogen-3 oxidase|nr:radical SAM family heme chaperone HemW [Clostridiales bacterium]
MKSKIGIYLHVPFCKKKCNYCAFNSWDNKNDLISSYFDALQIEIFDCVDSLKNYTVDTVYFGGGTPTCVNCKFFDKVLYSIENNFDVLKKLEIAIECNPGAFDRKCLKDISFRRFNRLSIGLQSTDNDVLKFLGRIHTFEEFIECYNLARSIGFKNISVDLIYGLPNQNLESWKRCLSDIIKFKLEHISCYCLEIEKGTPFFSSELNIPDDYEVSKMYDFSVKFLRYFGYERYEISNFCKKGYESKHNLKYWQCEDFVGFGASAHSNIGNVRYSNEKNIEKYIKLIKSGFSAITSRKNLDVKEKMSEFMFLGLRMQKGIKINEFKKKFNINIYDVFGEKIEKFLNCGLILRDNNNIFLSDRAFFISNKIFSEFLL